MILGEPFWYWLLFLAAAVMFATPLALVLWEKRQEKLDRQAWDEWWRL